MKYGIAVFVLALGLMGGRVWAAFYPAPQAETQRLKLLSATDEVWMRPVIEDFQQLYPTVAVEYRELETRPLMQVVALEHQQGQTADLVISSAMDLQVKLVNDGYAANHESTVVAELPAWAHWRKQAFAFTTEPAVMVYNKALLGPAEVPNSRLELIQLLRTQSERFRQKVGTYDISQSGLGYLYASQDAQQASTWGRLSESLSRVQVRLYGNTSAMLRDVAAGQLLLAYNVLGSYAQSTLDEYPDLGIILPSDYTLLMSRVAFVPKRALHPEAGHRFLDHLLSERGQRVLAERAHLYPLHPRVQGDYTYNGLQALAQGRLPLKRIQLGPALLTYQDHLKRLRFLRDWQGLMQPGFGTVMDE